MAHSYWPIALRDAVCLSVGGLLRHHRGSCKYTAEEEEENKYLLYKLFFFFGLIFVQNKCNYFSKNYEELLQNETEKVWIGKVEESRDLAWQSFLFPWLQEYVWF